MRNKYLMNGAAAMAMALTVAGCAHDSGLYQPTKEQIIENANQQLGLTLDLSADWNMTSTTKASITVNKDYGETYTVTIYSNHPVADNKGIVLAKGTISNGQTFTQEFEHATADSRLFVGVTDSKGYTSYKQVAVENGQLVALFGSNASAKAPRRAITIAEISAPYDAAWVANYLTTATVPNSTNIADNYDNTTYATNYGAGGPNYIDWNDPAQVAERDYFFSLNWDDAIVWALENHPTWLTINQDETFVRNFKITDEWTGAIDVVATEGYTDGVANNCERTVVVTGTWNLTADQRVGSLGRIIVAPGGTINISDGVSLQMVNEARLVVLAGGTINGGSIEVSNGNEAGRENYNAGTIEVAKFNNNFGKFYNYGTLKVDEYDGGAAESNLYNHSLVYIDHTGSSSNARIFNACQFYCKTNMRARNLVLASGSYFYVGGELAMSSSEDNTGDPTDVTLDNGAYLVAGTLNNQGTSWNGPSEGYAVTEFGNVSYLNYEDTDDGSNSGYFNGGIYVSIDDQTTSVSGKAGNQTCSDVFWSTVGSSVEEVEAGSGSIVIPADDDFVAGESGCTPGYQGHPVKVEEEASTWTYAFEDSMDGDYDMNDVVLKVSQNASDESKLDVVLCCTGATYNLKVFLGETALFGGAEVHAALAGTAGKFINTGSGDERFESKSAVKTTISKPAGFSFATADFWIQSPEGDIHVAGAGQSPYGIAVPGDWAWPTEWQRVTAKYPKFAKFASDASQRDLKWWE